MNKPILVVMAAGMGSRYGGSKQMDAVGANGEAIIDYSIYDAVKAGFTKVIIITKKEMVTKFKELVGDRISKHIEILYAYQELDDLPKGYTVPQGRTKPWGTCQAILSAEKLIDAPFVVINADDYYGENAYKMMYEFLSNTNDADKYNYAMVGYILSNTLTENGHVARGICSVDSGGYLQNVTERVRVEKKGNETYFTEDEGKTYTMLPNDSLVSMNMWGFSQSFLEEVRLRFSDFLDNIIKTNPLKGEYFLPGVVSQLLSEEKARVKVLNSIDKWFGVTYKADKEMVVLAIQNMHALGQYKTPLWDEKISVNYPLDIKQVIKAFDFGGEIIDCVKYGEGHINDTFCVSVKKESNHIARFILQHINSRVFRNPIGVMDNMVNVTSHLKDKIIKNGGNYLRETLTFIKTKDNKNYYVDTYGEVWRLLYFIEDTICCQNAEKSDYFYESAKSFGRFMEMLDDFDAETLYETIPQFHDTVYRLNNLKTAINEDKMNRVKLVQDEIEFALKRENDCSYLMDKLNSKKLPLRVTHNDTKLSNILIDIKTGKGVCVIDLDTIMPGLTANDFGDSIRAGATTAKEDEDNLSKVNFDIGLFEIYSRGYLEVTKNILTEEEKKSLPWGARLMTLESGIRFLTDYLNGDTYFKINRESQNLDRARNQFKLVNDMEKCFDKMCDIIVECSAINLL